MPTSTSRLSYLDCFDYFEQALADPRGLVIAFTEIGDARQFRLRMNAARKIDREENAEAYMDQQDHPLFGRSQYDGMQIKLRQGKDRIFLIIEKVETTILEVLPLSEAEAIEMKPIEVEGWKVVDAPKLEDRRF